MAEALNALPPAGGDKGALIVVEHPFWTALAEELRRRRGWPIVYDCMDELSGFSSRRNAAAEIEPRLMETADLVVASSDVLVKKAETIARRVALVRNGVEYEHFAGVGPPPRATEPVIGYYGAISRWFDAALVAKLAELRPRWRLKLIGRTLGADLGRLRRLPNVELLGERPYGELPAHLADWHCCIIPFKRIPLTEATNPVKVYEMLAAGRPVAAVELPELRPLADKGLIALAQDAEGFVAEIERMLSADSAEAVAERKAFAKANTWSRRCEEFAAAVAEIEG
jgi:glycosyltransferase involved in cell wall biosynthesis